MEQKLISKAVLAHQYKTMRVIDIMDYYGICSDKFYKLLDEAGIERKVKDREPRRAQIIFTLQD